MDWLRMRRRWKQSDDMRRPDLWTDAVARTNRATVDIGADTAADRAGPDTESDRAAANNGANTETDRFGPDPESDRAADNTGADTETSSADPETESDAEPNPRGVAPVLEP